MYGFATPKAVAIPVAVPAAVTCTNSISHTVSDAPAVHPRAAEVSEIAVTVNAVGAGPASFIHLTLRTTHRDFPSVPQASCT